MKSIAIVGLSKDSNIGDPILCESTLYICKSVAPQNRYKLLDLRGRIDKKTIFYIVNLPLKIINTIQFRFRKNKTLHLTFAEELYLNNYVRRNLKNVDMLIFAGGGLIETEHYCCNEYINIFTTYAQQHGMNIAFNAVGFNGSFNPKIKGYLQLKSILNAGNVVHISVRENLEEMNSNYLIEKKAHLVCDSGVWSAQCYGITKDLESDKVGIGVIRPNIFKEFNFNITEDDVVKFYIEFIGLLEKNNKKWELFTNGSMEDYSFGIHLLSKINLTNYKNYIKNPPKTGKKFLEDLAEYKVILCARMHASICSYSLQIPSIALLWNPKQIHFYNNIGYSERCVDIKQNSALSVYEQLKKAEECGFDIMKMNSFKNTIKESLNSFLNEGDNNE